MEIRKKLLASAAITTLVGLAPFAAHAGLLHAGGTVVAEYFNGVLAGPELEINAATGTAAPAALTAPVSYTEGALDLSAVFVGDTQITITNDGTFPLCSDGTSVGAACTDAISGFGFAFTGENILGVSVDPSSSADFLPVNANAHLGLQLIDPNDIRVDVTGDDPAVNSTLVLDLQFATPPPSSVPEPASLALLTSGLAGLGVIRRRRDPV